MQAGEANDGDLIGKVLGGRYRVTATIGRGGMGVVARAVDELLNREVAVKILRAYTDASPAELADLRTRMQREAQAAARIRHSGVVTVHDVTEEQGLPVIVMELVDGPSLDDVLAERGTLDPREAAAIGAKLMDALDAAHQVGVLHRDVKPGNVLLERGGRVVLTDFGIATMESGDEAMSKLTRSGELVGSLDFLPPERAQGREPGPASDIWSLGMTLYAAVEGTSPFRRTSVWSTLAAIVTDPLPEARNAGPLTPVLRALMAKEVEHRPTADQAREMLEQVAAGITSNFAAPAPAQAFGRRRHPCPWPAHTVPPAARRLRGTDRRAVRRTARRPGSGRRPGCRRPRAAPQPYGRRGGRRRRVRRWRDHVRPDGQPVGHEHRRRPGGRSRGQCFGGQRRAEPGRQDRRQRLARRLRVQGLPAGQGVARLVPAAGPLGHAERQERREDRTERQRQPQAQPDLDELHGLEPPGPGAGSYGYMAGSYHIETGPYETCPSVTLAKSGTKLWYHCYVINAHGNRWTYVRVEGSSTARWMSNDNLTRQSGPSTRC